MPREHKPTHLSSAPQDAPIRPPLLKPPLSHALHIAPSPAFGSGTGSSSVPRLSATSATTPSSQSQTHPPGTPLSPPTLVASPEPGSADVDKPIPLAAVIGPPPSPPEVESAPVRIQSSPSLSNSSDDRRPTRASIRAWAKATQAGTPRDTPSPSNSALLQSGSDYQFDRRSLTRSARHPTMSSVSHTHSTSSRSSNLPFPEDSSGNVADIESGEDSRSRGNGPSPLSSSPQRATPCVRASALPPPLPHRESSSSESSQPAIVVSHARQQDQQDRIVRRSQRHRCHRRRHRDRDTRDRDRDDRDRRSRGSANPRAPPPSPVPLPELRPPPPPLPPLRPLTLVSGGFDVLGEMALMVRQSHRPILRYPYGEGQGFVFRPRQNDVLDDIRVMIQMQMRGQ